jgi:sulfide:quinone oxidoreductase
MFGRTTGDAVRHSYADLAKPGMRFVRTAIRSIDPDKAEFGTSRVRRWFGRDWASY